MGENKNFSWYELYTWSLEMIFPSSKGSHAWYVAYMTRPAIHTKVISSIVVGKLTKRALKKKISLCIVYKNYSKLYIDLISILQFNFPFYPVNIKQKLLIILIFASGIFFSQKYLHLVGSIGLKGKKG